MAEGNYAIFVRMDEGSPLVITSRADLTWPEPSRPYAVIARLPYRELDNGLPAAGELDRVCRIEDQVTAVLEAKGALYLGHITGHGAMFPAYYSPVSVDATMSVKTSLLKKEKIEVQIHLDPSWAWFDGNMNPTEIEVEVHKYRQLFETLSAHGDKSELPRQVDFWAHFHTQAECAKFLQAIAADGYVRTSESHRPEAEFPYGCEFALTSPVTPDAIAPRCVYLRREATLRDGEFDGWACPVRTE